MKHIFYLLAIFHGFIALAQPSENNQEYRVSLSDLEIKSYPADSTANALVLYEYGKSYVDNEDYDLRTEIKRKIKIFNNEGFDRADVEIQLYKKNNFIKESVKDIFATTYNLENEEVTKTQLIENHIFTEETSENLTTIKFTLPNVKPGSVITYSYTLRSPYMRKYHGWYFQDEIPKLYSEYNTSIPGNWLYHIKLVGKNNLITHTNDIKKNCLQMSNGASADCAESVYAMKNIPAFVEEYYMTAKSNFISRIEYELETFRGMDGTYTHYTKTRKDVDKELRTEKDIGKQLRKSVDLEELLNTETLNETNPLIKAKAIYAFVQENYVWNQSKNIFSEVSIKDLLKEKSGNVGSINILLHNMLEEAGIEVKPVFISTRENGLATKLYPVITDFNYLIVQATIEGKTYLLDATDKYLDFGTIPFRCLNSYGRLVDFKTGSTWIDLNSNKKSSVFYQVNLKLDDQQNLKGILNSRTTGYHALHSKKAYFKNPNQYVANLENRNSSLEISNHSIKNSTKTSANFSESYNFKYNAEYISETIYLNPFLFPFFKENPFKLQERTYPIDFGYNDNYIYIFNLDLGENYAIGELPEEVNLALPNKTGHIGYSSKILGNKLNITFSVNFNESVYMPEYYPYLKEFMAKIVDIQTNSIVVLKKK